MEFGIGFITGRKNVCRIINSYYESILSQLGEDVNLTFFVLYDLNFDNARKEDFYEIDPYLYEKGVKIKYLGIEEIDLEKEIIQDEYNITEKEAELFIGHGYGKARNTIMYFALKNGIDYLFFWDDDEYPVACFKEAGKLIWKEQNNISEHFKNIKNSNVTFGYRCGYNSPVPYIDFNKYISEEDFKSFIDAVSNEAVSWESIKQTMEHDGITYAEEDILSKKKRINMRRLGIDEWLLGSGVCINMRDINKIPAFYNPPNARGEDTFFSTLLSEATVYRIPTYHFHDGFLKYTSIMDKHYPEKLRKIKLEDRNIEKRFLSACSGWIKYKPLLLYITHRQEYRKKINETYKNLEVSIDHMNKLFTNSDFARLTEELSSYDQDVQRHYREYIKTNNVWNKIKTNIKKNGD